MKNIKSIKKLRQLFKDVAKFNNETFGFTKGKLASARRGKEDDFAPYISMKKSMFFPEDLRSMHLSYKFANHICKTHFIINEENEDEIVTQDGSNISGGEKQRILFARSLFKDFELLILDEPTSSLDKENSFEVINNIFKKYPSKTIIIVTHKIDPRIQFDRILSLENGKINEKP